MTGNERSDDMIGNWLQEAAPDRLPQRVLAATFERTRRTRQDRAWRAYLRRVQMPRVVAALGGAAVAVMALVLALNLVPSFGPATPPTPSPAPTDSPTSTPAPPAPSVDPQLTELLNNFLGARVAGEGAEQFLSVRLEDVPLLYTTSAGARYERTEFDQVLGYEWPYGLTAFKVRLIARDTVVEQLLFTRLQSDPGTPDFDARDGRAALSYARDGFGTDIAPTTEGGQPVAVPYNAFDGEVTIQLVHPWVSRGASSAIQLVPEGPGIRPTTDGGQRNGWERLRLMIDPKRSGAGCPTSSDPADAAALAESIRSDPRFEATAPVALTSGVAPGLVMDVRFAPGAVAACGGLVGGTDGVSLGTGDRMRLYLFDAPVGLSMRALAIAIVVPEAEFERAVGGTPPVVEFHVQ